MSKQIYPCLLYTSHAKEAVAYYCSIFKDSKITSENELVVMFELNGQKFMALNGPDVKYTEAVSFVVDCDTQEEIDHYWNSLAANGGNERVCGWLTDKYGMSWQIVPSMLGELLSEPEKAGRVMKVVMNSKKLVIADMLNA